MKILDVLVQLVADWLHDVVLGILGHRAEDLLTDLVRTLRKSKGRKRGKGRQTRRDVK